MRTTLSLSQLFLSLVAAWNQDAASEDVDILAADLAARIGAAGHRVRLAVYRTDHLASLIGLHYFLHTCGLRLCYCTTRQSVIYAELTGNPESDYRARWRAVKAPGPIRWLHDHGYSIHLSSSLIGGLKESWYAQLESAFNHGPWIQNQPDPFTAIDKLYARVRKQLTDVTKS